MAFRRSACREYVASMTRACEGPALLFSNAGLQDKDVPGGPKGLTLPPWRDSVGLVGPLIARLFALGATPMRTRPHVAPAHIRLELLPQPHHSQTRNAVGVLDLALAHPARPVDLLHHLPDHPDFVLNAEIHIGSHAGLRSSATRILAVRLVVFSAHVLILHSAMREVSRMVRLWVHLNLRQKRHTRSP